MPQVIRAFPLRRSVAEVKAFASELNAQRASQTDQFYRHYGVSRESWHLQQTPSGPWVIAVTTIADPVEAAPRYADASEEFHVWFKERILFLTGVDPNSEPLGPETTEIFSWSDNQQP